MVTGPDLVSIQEVRSKVEQAWSAWTVYRRFTPSQIDSIVEAVASVARDRAQPASSARQCSCETAALLATAAQRAGAPEGLVGCIGTSTIEATNELMRHRRTAVILSTGGIVRAAYSSGKPAFGVGPGNVPVLVDPFAISSLRHSKLARLFSPMRNKQRRWNVC